VTLRKFLTGLAAGLAVCLAAGGLRAGPAAGDARPPAWRRAWTYAAGAPLAGAPAPLGGGWIVTTRNGRLAALDATGGERWSVSCSNTAFAGSAAAAGEAVVAATGDGLVMAFDAATGRALWQTNLAVSFRHGPVAVLRDGAWRVVALSAGDGALWCLDARTGREAWRTEPTNRSDGPPASDGRLVAFGNCDAAIHIFDAATGARVAKVEVGAEAQMAGGVAIRNGRVYGGTRAGELVCADPEGGGSLSWRVAVHTGEAWVTPAMAGDAVVMGTPDGAVAAFDARSGAGRWRVAAGGAVSALCVVDDAVFAAAGGSLVGLRLSDGGRFMTLPVGDDVKGPAANGRAVAVADDGGNVLGWLPTPGDKP